MDGEIQQLVDRTGVCLPLAARIIALFADSGASQIEMSIALDLAGKLCHMLPSKWVPDNHRASADFSDVEELPG